MTQHLKLRIHVTEPWDFERVAGTAELTGWTVDHVDPDNGEWEVHLDQGFDFNKRHIGTLLAGPRYVGERLDRMFDTVTGFPVRLAHRLDGDWQFAFAATISQRPDKVRREDQDSGTTI
ncbi:MAG TPA: hypothetical protein DCG90_02470 [Sphingobium sp.]|uniref:hypothetical protein n=1 Tax=unclassified Sphingobium TaxID=2611147 RepID=UPI0007F53E55|nr:MULTISPECIES: hypothetical protein [unclassified Sphingobium]OAN56977.1 hypothetical protein A7Q26_17300 [Sphingobium sp. TCM1]WIW87123.1 hypothetical protein K3M67_08930 [Sphingobium sp. V4]HAF40622.1 hypothetical protein [Sphingobium sp.]